MPRNNCFQVLKVSLYVTILDYYCFIIYLYFTILNYY